MRVPVRLRRWIPIAAVVLALLAAAGWPVYVRPEREWVSAADPADAVLALGGISTDTAYVAKDLVRKGLARKAVISNPYGPYVYGIADMCREPGTELSCFVPKPVTTRGEAREIARLARENGWDDVIVITPTYHVSRARFIIERCYRGRLRMVDPHIAIPLYAWPREYVYQSVGFARAAVQRGC